MTARKGTRRKQQPAGPAGRFEDVAKPSTTTTDYEPVARLIAPEPPPWLAEHLVLWSSTVWLQAQVMKFQPSRAKMREHLRLAENAVMTLRRALGAPPVREFLDVAGDGKIAYHGVIDAYLADLGARAARALSRSELATSEGKTKAGKGLALPPGAVHAASLCALYVAEAWKHFRGAYPGPRNKTAAEAAERYWKVCGNKRNSWGANPLTAWRRHFEEAMSPTFDGHRREVVLHLRLSEGSAGSRAAADDPGVDSNPLSRSPI